LFDRPAIEVARGYAEPVSFALLLVFATLQVQFICTGIDMPVRGDINSRIGRLRDTNGNVSLKVERLGVRSLENVSP
jgi:hypothetical protein